MIKTTPFEMVFIIRADMSTNAGGIIYELQLDAPEKIDYSVICEEIMGDG